MKNKNQFYFSGVLNLQGCKLILENGEIMNIGIRSDGYINAMQLCKAGGKAFADYQKSKQTQDYYRFFLPI